MDVSRLDEFVLPQIVRATVLRDLPLNVDPVAEAREWARAYDPERVYEVHGNRQSVTISSYPFRCSIDYNYDGSLCYCATFFKLYGGVLTHMFREGRLASAIFSHPTQRSTFVISCSINPAGSLSADDLGEEVWIELAPGDLSFAPDPPEVAAFLARRREP